MRSPTKRGDDGSRFGEELRFEAELLAHESHDQLDAGRGGPVPVQRLAELEHELDDVVVHGGDYQGIDAGMPVDT